MKYRTKDSAAFARAVTLHAEAAREEEKQRRKPRSTGAHTTMPIKDMRDIRRWIAVAKAHDAHMREGGVSWYLLLTLGFNTALRIGDLCKLRVRDVRGREYVNVIQDKTDKMSDVPLKASTQAILARALKGKAEDDFVFASRQRSRTSGGRKAISRQRCYAIVQEIARRADYAGRVGCHTMRKTFAWQYYQVCGDLAEVQKVLNHSSQDATIRYLGLDREKIRDTVQGLPEME